MLYTPTGSCFANCTVLIQPITGQNLKALVQSVDFQEQGRKKQEETTCIVYSLTGRENNQWAVAVWSKTLCWEKELPFKSHKLVWRQVKSILFAIKICGMALNLTNLVLLSQNKQTLTGNWFHINYCIFIIITELNSHEAVPGAQKHQRQEFALWLHTGPPSKAEQHQLCAHLGAVHLYPFHSCGQLDGKCSSIITISCSIASCTLTDTVLDWEMWSGIEQLPQLQSRLMLFHSRDLQILLLRSFCFWNLVLVDESHSHLSHNNRRSKLAACKKGEELFLFIGWIPKGVSTTIAVVFCLFVCC